MARNIKTQKAKGIMNGINTFMKNGGNFFNKITNAPAHVFVGTRKEAKNISAGVLPGFARPCPKIPRHGFVDSKVVKTKKELVGLFDEAREVDSDAEIVIGPVFNGVRYNSVYTSNGTITVGKGHDGATGGHDTISFPTAPMNLDKKTLKDSGLSDKDTAYIESIYTYDGNIGNEKHQYIDTSKINYTTHITQIRGGPEVNVDLQDFIPDDVYVSQVVTPNNNLVEWESQVKEFDEGTVVYAPGSSLSSHAAIHCFLRRIPFITSFEPKVGQVIEQVGMAENFKNNRRFKCGVAAAFEIMNKANTKVLSDYFLFALSIIHNWPYLSESTDSDWLIGAASTIYAILGTAVIMGENRHSSTAGRSTPRHIVYTKCFDLKEIMMKPLSDIMHRFYTGDWSPGFGGLNWAWCSIYNISIWNNIISIYNSNSELVDDEKLNKLVSSLNLMANISHNNGLWFDKLYHDMSILDFAADQPAANMIVSSAMLYDVYEELSRVPDHLPVLNNIILKDNPFVTIDNISYLIDVQSRRGSVDVFYKTIDGVIKKTVKTSDISSVNKFRPNIDKYGDFKIPGARETFNIYDIWNGA